MLYNFVIHIFTVPSIGFEISTITADSSAKGCSNLLHQIAHGNFTTPRHLLKYCSCQWSKFRRWERTLLLTLHDFTFIIGNYVTLKVNLFSIISFYFPFRCRIWAFWVFPWKDSKERTKSNCYSILFWKIYAQLLHFSYSLFTLITLFILRCKI